MSLALESLTKRFGGLLAVDSVTFQVPEGRISGLIGPNGAGKTTIFNLITGIYEPTTGKILLGGDSIASLKPNAVARRGIARTFQNIRLFSQLTVLENVLTALQNQATYTVLDSIVRTKRFRQEEAGLRKRAAELVDLAGLGPHANTQARNLPYGHQRRLEIARALAVGPRVLLLDEPAAGMNEEESRQLASFIRQVQRDFDLTILLIEHHMDLVMEICEQIFVLNFGRLIAQGNPAEIRANPEVVTAYLGGDD